MTASHLAQLANSLQLASCGQGFRSEAKSMLLAPTTFRSVLYRAFKNGGRPSCTPFLFEEATVGFTAILPQISV